MLTKTVVYDLEVLPNVFLNTIFNPTTCHIITYEISYRRNDYRDMMSYLYYLEDHEYQMAGFNNFHYDYVVLDSIYNMITDTSAEAICERAYETSQKIFRAKSRHDNTIYDYAMRIHQIDPFKIHHFDNKAKTASLKRLEFNMRRRRVLEYSQDFSAPVTDDKHLDELIIYNQEDVLSTYDFLVRSAEHIKFRKSLVNELTRAVYNYNDTKIGEKLIVNRLEEVAHTDDLYYWDEDPITGEKSRRPRQTVREHIDIKDIVFSYISFKHREFQKVFDFMKSLRVYTDGSRFEWSDKPDYLMGRKQITYHEGEIRRLTASGADKEKIHRMRDELSTLKDKYKDYKIQCECKGMMFQIGKGGLHAALPWTKYQREEGWVIKDVDVTSFYPSIAIQNRMKPEHLPDEFIDIYEGMKIERLGYPKSNPRNKALKLSLNGTYGKTNSVFSIFYDPKYTLTTVINGQLMLLMLWDMLSTQLAHIKIIQANTDGISYYIREQDLGIEERICRQWEQITGMELEHTEYQSMYLRDVNNYVAQDIHGSVKAKGAYNYLELFHDLNMDPSSVAWHKDHSNIVVQKAAVAHLLEGKDIERYIIGHKDIFDFFLCTNVNRSSRLLWGDEEVQRNSRYVVSLKGKPLVKVMPPLKTNPTKEREIGINVGYLTTIHNDVETMDVSKYNIDYGFYIREAEKLVGGFRE